VQAAADANAAAILIEGGPVSTVNGQAGTVLLTAADVGAATPSSVTSAVNAAIAALKDGVSTSFDTLAEIAADLGTKATTLTGLATSLSSGLATKEPVWSAPAAYNSGASLNRQSIIAASNLTLDLATLNPAVGSRFRVQTTAVGVLVTLNGTGQRFRDKTGAFVTEAFVVDLPYALHEFTKVSTTDWELS
jgi:hypothetical protein